MAEKCGEFDPSPYRVLPERGETLTRSASNETTSGPSHRPAGEDQSPERTIAPLQRHVGQTNQHLARAHTIHDHSGPSSRWRRGPSAWLGPRPRPRTPTAHSDPNDPMLADDDRVPPQTSQRTLRNKDAAPDRQLDRQSYHRGGRPSLPARSYAFGTVTPPDNDDHHTSAAPTSLRWGTADRLTAASHPRPCSRSATSHGEAGEVAVDPPLHRGGALDAREVDFVEDHQVGESDLLELQLDQVGVLVVQHLVGVDDAGDAVEPDPVVGGPPIQNSAYQQSSSPRRPVRDRHIFASRCERYCPWRLRTGDPSARERNRVRSVTRQRPERRLRLPRRRAPQAPACSGRVIEYR